MGVLDKIKNALFEVEYVEVDEPPKKEKKVKVKEKEKKEVKPIAKKIVLPGKKEEKVEELKEEDLKDDNFESRPKDEVLKEKNHDNFKIMDDEDFTVDEFGGDEPEILQVIDEESPMMEEDTKLESVRRIGRSRLDSYEERVSSIEKEIPKKEDNSYSNPNYSYSNSRESRPYGMDSTYSLPVHEYGTYEKKEEKNTFKPSPIISPIYGILDKNYKKEDVVQKKEVRITSSYKRSNVSVDDIRDKAYGSKESFNLKEVDDNSHFELDEEDDDNLLVDLSDHAKPEVKELTMGDALEYFQDLGLEYNVDYVDVSKERGSSRKIKENDNVSHTEKKLNNENNGAIVEDENGSSKHASIKINDENRDDSTSIVDNQDDDNLFDLIDSMYQESE